MSASSHEVDNRRAIIKPLMMHCLMSVLSGEDLGLGAAAVFDAHIRNFITTDVSPVGKGDSTDGVVESVAINAMYALKLREALAHNPVLPATPNLHPRRSPSPSPPAAAVPIATVPIASGSMPSPRPLHPNAPSPGLTRAHTRAGGEVGGEGEVGGGNGG